ncbi:MAG TPA: hypothetical protein VF392_03795 [Terracidiphilus sp.]
MFCSGCGTNLAPGQPVCPQCGRPVAPPAPPIPNLEFQVNNFAGRVRALGIVWMIWGAISILFGILGMSFANSFFHGGFGPWGHGPWANGGMPPFMGPAFFHLIWVYIVIRAALAFAAGYGLMQHAPWGRGVAIVAGFLTLLKFPFGTALGIWTLVTLMGYRNATLYDQL